MILDRKTWWTLLRDVGRFDASKLQLPSAARNVVAVVVPLAVAAPWGYTLTGLTVSTGALNVAFSDQPGPYRLRAGRMLFASALGAISAFLGAVTGQHAWLAVAVLVVWSLTGGMLVSLGPGAEQVGLTSIVLFLVYGAFPLELPGSAIQGALILVGGLLQTAVSLAAWPLRQFGPERQVLSTVFQHLALSARSSFDPTASPPLTAQLSTASTTLRGLGSAHSGEAEAFRSLLNEAERIRLEIVALDTAQRRLGRLASDTTISNRISHAREVASSILDAFAVALRRAEAPVEERALVEKWTSSVDEVRDTLADGTGQVSALQRQDILSHLEALGGQLRACLDIDRQPHTFDARHRGVSETLHATSAQFRDWYGTLRATFTLQSASFRHALRLAIVLGIASASARSFGLARPYWVPLTAAIVLKPNFDVTFSRGLGRMAGTFAGLVLATVFVHATFGGLAHRIILIGLLTFYVRGFGPANFTLSAVAITALVVILTSFVGSSPDATIASRGVDTLTGGILALTAYMLWPTWERTQTPEILATMLDAYRKYFDAVMERLCDPTRSPSEDLEDARLAARLARSNAEESIDRLRNEPGSREEDVENMLGVLANSHRFVNSALKLEANLYGFESRPMDALLGDFVRDVDTTLAEFVRALRSGSRPAELPDLRADHGVLVERERKLTAEDDGRDMDTRIGSIAIEADRMTNSLNTIAGMLRRGD